MAEEIVTIQVPVEIPENLRSVFYDINNKFSKLAQVLYGNLDIATLRSRVIQTRVLHGKPNKLKHTLDKEATAVLLCSGRVSYYSMLQSSLNSVTVKPFLASTISTSDTKKFTDQIRVADASIFRVGDEILIDSDFTAAIKNIQGNILTLSKEVYFSGTVGVSLNAEFTQFLII